MTFKELLDDLKEFTDEFTLDRGVYQVENKADVQNAVNILKHYYINVDGNNLDYNNNDVEGISYLIRYSRPFRRSEEQ